MKKLLLFTTVLFVFVLTSIASAGPNFNFGFENITNNDPGDAAIGEAQLSMEVFIHNDSLVEFVFLNSGPEDSSITDIYFDDDSEIPNDSISQSFASVVDIDDSQTGVEFSQFANPANLPGGNAIAFPFEAEFGFTFDSDPPPQPNGVNPGESLSITLATAINAQQIIDDLTNSDLRVGIHVQGFASGGSESFINGPPGTPPPGGGSPIPEPGTMALMGFGLIGLAGIGRRIKI